MKRGEVKRGLISLGIAFLISAPISRMAMQSWNNPPQPIFEELPEAFNGPQSSDIKAKAHEIFEAERKRQELIQEEQERMNRLDIIQQEIISEAEDTLEEYEVVLPEDIRWYCEQAQEESGVCAEFLEAVAWRESRYNPKAENDGCLGIMQISTKWHRDRMKRLGVNDIYDAEDNIRVGADYLAELFEKYDGDTYKVLMTYNGDTSEGVSNYAIEICEVAAALERVHGK